MLPILDGRNWQGVAEVAGRRFIAEFRAAGHYYRIGLVDIAFSVLSDTRRPVLVDAAFKVAAILFDEHRLRIENFEWTEARTASLVIVPSHA